MKSIGISKKNNAQKREHNLLKPSARDATCELDTNEEGAVCNVKVWVPVASSPGSPPQMS